MRREGLGIGIFFLAAGVLFLLDALETLDLRAEFLLPLLLIGFGIALIAGGREPAPAPEPAHEHEPETTEGVLPPPPPPTEEPEEDRDGDVEEP